MTKICKPMKQIVVTLTEEQQALIKLSATAIDAKASKSIIEAMDATDSVEINSNDFGEVLERTEEQNQMIVAIGLIAMGKIGKDL